MSTERIFFTIGYQGRSQEAYIKLLLEHDVRLLCDVRRNPISRKPGFSKTALAISLNRVGISYQHMPQLGIASEERDGLHTDSDYKKLFQRYEIQTLASQQERLAELNELLLEHGRIAITCFEAEVEHCHRSRVAKAMSGLADFAARIVHL